MSLQRGSNTRLYFPGFGPKVRVNSDVIVTTYQTQKRTLDALYEDYAAFFGKKGKEIFYQTVQKYTKVS